jgi:hypothetical protein
MHLPDKRPRRIATRNEISIAKRLPTELHPGGSQRRFNVQRWPELRFEFPARYVEGWEFAPAKELLG